jgi:hypothetical protein
MVPLRPRAGTPASAQKEVIDSEPRKFYRLSDCRFSRFLPLDIDEAARTEVQRPFR